MQLPKLLQLRISRELRDAAETITELKRPLDYLLDPSRVVPHITADLRQPTPVAANRKE
jgi:hypothetical protein